MKLTEVVEDGVRFKTGLPVCFTFVRNTDKAHYYASRFQQNIEPAGRYLLHNEHPVQLPRGWETGSICFEKPLVLAFNEASGGGYDEHSWKASLVRHFREKGHKLSKRLLEEGFDGIVTTEGKSETKEIVALVSRKWDWGWG